MAFKAKILAFVWIILQFSFTFEALSTEQYKKVCQGTSNELSVTRTDTPQVRYSIFKERYEGCVSVDGNLEITNFGTEIENFSFLRSIEEVTGYILIATAYVERIPLTGLRIIRGRTLFGASDYTPDGIERNRTRNYSLYVAFNYVNNGDGEKGATDGLTHLVMPNLTEISAGSVLFLSNARLCFVDSIDWTDILSGEAAKAIIGNSRPHCGQCPDSCRKGLNQTTRHCWTKKHCQTFSRVLCAPQCSGRCFGRDPNQCCHTECAAGCTGPQDSDCHSCKNFANEGRCVPYCPQQTIYDPKDFVHKPNPNAKYTYGSQCVNECPKHMMVSKGACVSDCGQGQYADEKRNCVECHPCPISCRGTGDTGWVHAGNIQRFENCTLVQGSLKIQVTTFSGDPSRNIRGLNVSELDVLQNVVEITDYLRVDSDHEELRSLSFLRNLKIIQGRNSDKGVSALRIVHTNLELLDLGSLREVRNGKVIIGNNPHLCFTDSFNWARLLAHPEQTVHLWGNRNATECEAEGFTCSQQCTPDGCMGPSDSQCFNCSNYRFGPKCISTCAEHSSPYLAPIDGNDLECVPCHENCLRSCSGTGDDQCESCRYLKDGSRCVRDCPPRKYASKERVCLPCSPNCDKECHGPDNTVSPTGCKTCEHLIYRKDSKFPECLANDMECPPNYYNDIKSDCRRCHDECLNCTEYGADKCHWCRHFEQDNVCVASCSAYHYADGHRCHRCHEECLECHGPYASDCKACRVYKLYEDFEQRTTKFNCTKVCPELAPNKLRDGNSTICVSDESVSPDGKKLVAIIAGVVCGGIFFLGLTVIIMVLRRQVARTEEKKLRLTAKMNGIVECEPLTPSNAKPDMAVLRLIKESDIRRGGIIGSGAFGTVYKGLWVPEGENVKIPVAIKVLQEGAGENSNLLEEARIMASVVHPSCLHVLAVCLTAQVMLVTQLMPLGCLLDYVRKNRDGLGSKVILNWCTQIARGMSYFEERGILHRDLAARNVLVHSPSHVKITDFGLAKLVDEDGRFHSTGGKLPIKWLALECIQSRIFTHKSDVWSFGVTVWELCTYGQRPYESVNASEIVGLLEKGERLPQPSICTIDVYMIMIKCWMLGAGSRPSFAELAEEFAKMARDPGRYLVIPNDKLMRLPSQPADSHELLRNVSLTLDGPEEVITADEYVNEHSKKSRYMSLDKVRHEERQTPIGQDDGRPSQNTEPVQGHAADPKNVDLTGSGSNGPSSRLRLAPRLELVTQNRLSGAGYGDEGSQDSPRYSPDPCSLSYQSAFPVTEEEEEEELDRTIPGPSAQATAAKEDGTEEAESMRLALDGSDYLQPKSSAMMPVSYLELVDYSGTDGLSSQGDVLRDVRGEKDRSSLLTQSPSSAIENPEYFQSTNATPLLVGEVP